MPPEPEVGDRVLVSVMATVVNITEWAGEKHYVLKLEAPTWFERGDIRTVEEEIAE